MKVQVKKDIGTLRIDGVDRKEGETFEIEKEAFVGLEEVLEIPGEEIEAEVPEVDVPVTEVEDVLPEIGVEVPEEDLLPEVPAPELPKNSDEEAEDALPKGDLLPEVPAENEKVFEIDMNIIEKATREDLYKYVREIEKELGVRVGIHKTSTLAEIRAAVNNFIQKAQ